VSPFLVYQVIKEYAHFFQEIFDETSKDIKPLPVFFQHEKRYRKVRGIEAFGKRFYLKEYYAQFDEAEAEWKNLLRLKELGFSVPEPFFFLRLANRAVVATFEIKGVPLSELLQTHSQERKKLIFKLSELLANLHSQNIYYQDCYLNHFYWHEDSQTLSFLDVPRVLFNPPFPLRYQIKDLGQVGYSFEEYLKEEGRKAFQTFLFYYLENIKSLCRSHKRLIKILAKTKVWLIRRRTLRARRKGKVL
jgi:tRNA A-37 threonylcarbamoyl transferase component Bud32